MRFFIALEIPKEVKQQVNQTQRELREILPNLHLTDTEKLHLTFVFIGEQHDSLEKSLIKLLVNATSGVSPFNITPSYLDGFPNIHHPQTIWLGVKGDIDKLFLIRERIKDGLERLELNTDERRFVPHIAIAKSKDLVVTPSEELHLQKMMQQKTFSLISVSSIKLFQSIPNESFHVHNTLAEIPLLTN